MNKKFLIFSIFSILFVLFLSTFSPLFYGFLVLIVPLVGIGIFDMIQTKHTIKRNFPLFGRGRWVMEKVRPFLRQYIMESDVDGAPINRVFREVVYQRAKAERDTIPFGTKFDVYHDGYEWMEHSLSAIDISKSDHDLRITIGGNACKKPYSSSIFNISAMSFGALSGNAIESLNFGAKLGDFSHNTGEGGISHHHIKHGGDLVWQIGTAYFGCRDEQGHFCEEKFKDKATIESVKMIEIKLSQGAKPGHGGILPADKNSIEISEIRGIRPHTQVDSPSTHSTFRTPIELMRFVEKLRHLSGGKPVGFKLSIGRRSEFISICKAMIEIDVRPDFITIDGGEGGTGAAPLEYTDSIGMPLREAIAFVCNCLIGFDLKTEIKIIVSGKIFTGFHMVKNFSLGADICNSARGNMLALGCVQSLICNTNKCPTGIATQDPLLANGLVVKEKSKRIVRYHNETVKAAAEIIASAGLNHTNELNRTYIIRRVNQEKIATYDEIFPYIDRGSLLNDKIPDSFKLFMSESNSAQFSPEFCLTSIDKKIEVV